ncbi:hypothetical protein IAQ61_001817 [Plenodomus lingam]|uniref:uncharacterized protein n=1 Tax=Leptosphaeria maculans TaxID=5022 RepID=UPI00331A575C|nr:hypothetical protein IAQ61_001817 [Plenodomus lingam]
MKVAEKATDRTAYVHIYVEGKMEPVGEYGEYVDPADNAICCYVPLEKGQVIRIGGKFSGTLDAATFLHKAQSGTVDAKMIVAPLANYKLSQWQETETIGTMELRLYITRQLGVTHRVKNMNMYYIADTRFADTTETSVLYNQIAPSFQMAFEQDTVVLDGQKALREQRKMDSVRPGNEAWAIFRFHYRCLSTLSSDPHHSY